MEDSIIAVTVESMRPDIEEAKVTPDKIKSKLVYRDEDELETGMQKVQPLTFLDEEIEAHKDAIHCSVSEAQEIQDAIPSQVLDKVEHVIQVAKEGETTLFKASQLLEFTSDAFSYARRASQNKSELKKESVTSLRNYDEAFRKMIDSRFNAQMDEASDRQEDCFEFLEKAVAQAESDHENQVEWAEKEESEMKEEVLKEIQEAVDETISDEKSELEMIKSQCNKDVSTIDQGLSALHTFMDKSSHEYQEFEQHCSNQLQVNRAEQRDLEERLRRLKEEEKKLVHQITTGKELQKTSNQARSGAVGEIAEWKGRINELCHRTETSLQVMEEMKSCTDMIMDDAMKWKKTRRECLDRQELESLLILRDSLLAQGAMQKMVLSDSENNANLRRREVSQVEKEKKEAARTGFTEKVKELGAKISAYKSQMSTYEKKIEDTKQKLDEIAERLATVDGKLKARKDSSRVRLDSIEDRYKRLKKFVDKAYDDNETTDKVSFDSLMSYTASAN